MVMIKIRMAAGEMVIDFSDTKDLEDQIAKIDFEKIEKVIDSKVRSTEATKPQKASLPDIPVEGRDLGVINLLKVFEGGEDALKLAIFLAAKKLNGEEIKRITGVTILSS